MVSVVASRHALGRYAWLVLSPLPMSSTSRTSPSEYEKVNAGYVSWASNCTFLFTCDASGSATLGNIQMVQLLPLFKSPYQRTSQILCGLSMFPYVVLDEEGTKAVFTSYRDGRSVLDLIDVKTAVKQEIESPYVVVENMRAVSLSVHQFAFVGQEIDEGQRVVRCNISDLDTSSPSTSFTTWRPNSNIGQFDSCLASAPQGMYHPKTTSSMSCISILITTSIPGQVLTERSLPVVSAHGGPTGFRLKMVNPIFHILWVRMARRQLRR
ncbi:hypothetical protein E1B28_002496 [Marasmius oreades]|uniref:Uncharacterized protein n=1 Tax=Marasmius oreades TaxID=181124 RepID=A0A9P7RMR5_9AGAR|nr:uncharacterized protein E1B28_002496 [Marasmius oreades]KAG7086546.1 hypothetical protein E1B28_002496 [Marasmius oreades]